MSFVQKALDSPDKAIAAQKHILAVFCNPNIFDVPALVSKGMGIKAACFIGGNFPSLREQFLAKRRRFDEEKSKVYIDNTSRHASPEVESFSTHNGAQTRLFPRVTLYRTTRLRLIWEGEERLNRRIRSDFCCIAGLVSRLNIQT
jgi:hypothetical protein